MKKVGCRLAWPLFNRTGTFNKFAIRHEQATVSLISSRKKMSHLPTLARKTLQMAAYLRANVEENTLILIWKLGRDQMGTSGNNEDRNENMDDNDYFQRQ